MKRFVWACLLVGLTMFGAGCSGAGDSSGAPTLPADELQFAVAPNMQATPSLTASPTLPPTVTPTDTPPPPLPTDTPRPTDTPGPHEHVVQPNENCLGIATIYGHVSIDVIAAIERLNNIRCSGLQQGATILVPRPTVTPTEIGADLTQTVIATNAPPMVTLDAMIAVSVQEYVVEEGDTLSSIALKNDSTLRQICELNPLPDGINCSGCTWESANCCCPNPPLFSVGDRVNVPAPSPTPTPSPTFTGSETPTHTPTHRAPQAVYPLPEATVQGPVRLTWLSVGVLARNETYEEQYLVSVRNETSGEVLAHLTRQLSYDVPAEFLPADGTPTRFVWQVRVVRMEPGVTDVLYPVGGVMFENAFSWQGW